MRTLLSRKDRLRNDFPQLNQSTCASVEGKPLLLALSALGVVFGDIGTSPLYAIKECFHGIHSIALTEGNALGVLSLIFWSLNIVVSVKYVVFILRADNRGEGGIFALLGLVPANDKTTRSSFRSAAVLAGIVGAGLLYGDGVITPAISVLSAIEGLEVATKAATPFVVPLTLAVLAVLFLLQHRGTMNIGKAFGPIMLIWFGAIGALGLIQIIQQPHILLAVNPAYAYDFFSSNRSHGFLVLGSVVLCFTGGEALYADLGHFGRWPIRISWFGIACPALLLNYFGQGALLLDHPEFNVNPFYGAVPSPLLYPMVGLSTVATVIASQALISGAFSLTQQAVQLGFCPRLHIVHTSYEMRGQIYIPSINYFLMVACMGVVLGFRSSSGLAGAYGIAVTGTMIITSLLYFLVIIKNWHWPLWKAVSLVTIFLGFDIAYFGANLLKLIDGGWFTLAVAALVAVLMLTWRRGREELNRKLLELRLPLHLFIEDIVKHHTPRVRGTAVFMTISPVGTPPALLHHIKHNHMIHETVILFSIIPADVPCVPEAQRIKIEDLGSGFYRLIVSVGFMDLPHVPQIMKIASTMGLQTEPLTTTFYLGRETMLTTGKTRMMRWRKALFAYMSRNAGNPAAYFGLPANRVVELGTQIEL